MLVNNSVNCVPNTIHSRPAPKVFQIFRLLSGSWEQKRIIEIFIVGMNLHINSKYFKQACCNYSSTETGISNYFL